MNAMFLLLCMELFNFLLIVFLTAACIYLNKKRCEHHDELMRLRARLNTVTDKGNPIKMKKSPCISKPDKVEFNLDVLDLGDI